MKDAPAGTSLAAQVEAAQRAIANWPADVKRAMGLEPTPSAEVIELRSKLDEYEHRAKLHMDRCQHDMERIVALEQQNEALASRLDALEKAARRLVVAAHRDHWPERDHGYFKDLFALVMSHDTANPVLTLPDAPIQSGTVVERCEPNPDYVPTIGPAYTPKT